eukprot:CAMPEP_0113585490 /NCGR_PEP_ID=MMETSP0015_2-20120614/33728_1 /TAXON_ID=2838 /ORGANISM="Odontella" /LENGTH=31 /DNA_ID=CAMNT_0000490737 /DNA_START=123 /DNA_END=215 /DNA_ORIENTATION=- /assembly_acc=CAM_ASM_000160
MKKLRLGLTAAARFRQVAGAKSSVTSSSSRR